MDHSACSGVLQVPFMDIQANWDDVIRNAGAKFWVSCKRAGEKTQHGSLQKPQESSAHGADGKFLITDHSQCSLTVECPEAGMTTTFVRPLETLHLHKKKLLCMDVSVSGALGASSSVDGSLCIWDAETGEIRRKLEGHIGDVNSCQFFPSGIVLLSAGADLRLKIWSAQDGSCPRTLVGHTRGVNGTAVVDRGKNVISVSSDGTARLWDCGTGQCLSTLVALPTPIHSCAIAASTQLSEERGTHPPSEPECGTSGKLLLLACEDRAVRGCDVRNRETVFTYRRSEGSPSHLSCVFVSETHFVCGAEDGTLSVVDTRNTEEAVSKVCFSGSPVHSLLALGEGKCLAGCGDGSAVCWRVGEPAVCGQVTRLTGPELDSVTSVRQAGGLVYTSCRDGCVRVYSSTHID